MDSTESDSQMATKAQTHRGGQSDVFLAAFIQKNEQKWEERARVSRGRAADTRRVCLPQLLFTAQLTIESGGGGGRSSFDREFVGRWLLALTLGARRSTCSYAGLWMKKRMNE